MRCRRAKNMLALHAGGDLPDRDMPALMFHLRHCPDCAGELDEMKRSLKRIRTLSEKDVPPPLPSDFPDRVSEAAMNRAGKKSRKRPVRHGPLTWRPAMVLGGIALLLLLTFSISKVFRQSQKSPDGIPDAAARQTAEAQDAPPIWRTAHPLAKSFDGPYPLETWPVPREAAVYAIMHREDRANGPGTYIIDYCGESGNMASYRGYPWMRHRLKRLLRRSGSPENLYIAVHLMPESSKNERRILEKDIIDTFKPFFNQGV